ncbi:MAG: septal ring lytic transglycosylase RlpA family protein [Rhizomicrobium sp.]|jgi:rare lipoprotein A
MLRTTRGLLGTGFCTALLAACATQPPPTTTTAVPGGRSSYKVGIPYQVGDTWYYPHEQSSYDETGIASWYGPTFYGKPTADGEIYDGEGLTAAHRTLPMPVNVRVTNLENGKSLVLRVNDRGPFAIGRIIDVSRHAAELLGFYAKGTAQVRVTYLGRADLPSRPDESQIARAVRSAPPARAQVVTRMASRPSPKPVQVAALEPPPASDPTNDVVPTQVDQPDEPVTADSDQKTTRLYVQAGTFSSPENAERLKADLGAGVFVSPSERDGRPLYRVRSGPYDDLEAANAALARLSELGKNGAQIVVDQ